jgi:hypothetical protein
VIRKYDEGWPEHTISLQVGTTVSRILQKHYDKGDVGRLMLFVNGSAEKSHKAHIRTENDAQPLEILPVNLSLASNTRLKSAGIKKIVKTVDRASPPTTTLPRPR